MSFQQLYETASQKFSANGTDTSLSDWITVNTTLRRRPFSYDRYPFQEQIADDEHPNLSVIKCSQVGLTEIQIRKFFAMLRRENGLSGIFSFPNEAMYKRNYATRMKPIIDNDAVFNPPNGGNKPIRRMDLTQISDSFGYVTGCGESDATSINADILFHDELDLSPPDMISLFQSRLQGSDKRITQSFSTPTFLGYGIDRNFTLSDQNYYLVRCPSCGHWQFPLFNTNFIRIPKLTYDIEHLTDLTAEQISELDLKGAYVGCEKTSCRKPLDLANRRHREWVPNFPNRDSNRGYKMNPFSTDRLDLKYIMGQLQKYREKENMKGFFNTVLGEPFTESSAQLQRDQIEKVMANTPNAPNVGHDTAVYMGIDMGQVCHIVLCGDVDSDGKDPFFLFDTCHVLQLTDRINDLRKTYNIVQCCVDRYPYTPTVDAFRENTNGLIMPIHFGGNAAVQPKLDEAEQLIYYIANRTSMLDRVRTVITNETAVLAGYGGYKETLVTHLRDMVRDETALEKEPEWKKLNGNDHFFFAMGYALLARRVSENIFTRQYSKTLMVSAIEGTDIGTNSLANLNNNRSVNKLGLGRR